MHPNMKHCIELTGNLLTSSNHVALWIANETTHVVCVYKICRCHERPSRRYLHMIDSRPDGQTAIDFQRCQSSCLSLLPTHVLSIVCHLSRTLIIRIQRGLVASRAIKRLNRRQRSRCKSTRARLCSCFTVYPGIEKKKEHYHVFTPLAQRSGGKNI